VKPSGLGTTVEEEIVAKWLELLHTGLPVCALSAGEVALPVPSGRLFSLSLLACTAKNHRFQNRFFFGALEITLGNV
jgi:hypothetical protein